MNRNGIAGVITRLAIAVTIVGVTLLLIALLSGCKNVDNTPVPVAAPALTSAPDQRLADCSDTMMFGPCVYLDAAADGQTHWYYVAEGGMYPGLNTYDLGMWTQAGWGADVAPQYVPLCEDVDAGKGPCVGRRYDAWVYVRWGNQWPNGSTIATCPTEDGGPQPCVWVISQMGAHPNAGDSGVLVYGL